MQKLNKRPDLDIITYNGSSISRSASGARPTLPAWRGALLGTVAAGALMLAHDNAVLAGPDDCDISVPGVAVCSGNQSNGIVASPFGGEIDLDLFPTVNVNNLTQDIAPVGLAPGIALAATGDVTLISNTTDGPEGPVQITTAGAVTAIDVDGENVSVSHTGDITSGGGGISVFSAAGSSGTAYVSFTGNINATASGIVATADEAVEISSEGNITSTNGGAIGAVSVNAGVTVESIGDLNTYAGAINVNGAQDVMVTSTGDITSAFAFGMNIISDGITTVVSEGNISPGSTGIFASGELGVEVTSTGDISSIGPNSYRGIDVLSINGTAAVFSRGDITVADDQGIFANGDAGVQIESEGVISSQTGDGIRGVSANGGVTIIQEGNVFAGDTAIDANAAQGVQVDSTGDIVSEAGFGIATFSANGGIEVSSTGNLTVENMGISASAAQNIEIGSEGDITTTGIGGGMFLVSSGGSIVATSEGNLDVYASGIVAQGQTGVQITSEGNVTAAISTGISAVSAGGTAVISSEGNISAGSYGIFASGQSGTQVTSTGDITNGAPFPGYGIRAQSSGGATIVSSTGDIDVSLDGIFARSDMSTVNVVSEGTITAQQIGINVDGAQAVEVRSEGVIDAGDTGIRATSDTGSVEVISDGDIVSTTSDGIAALSGTNTAIVSSTGNITAATNGILANGLAGVDITTSGGAIDGNVAGVGAISLDGAVTVNNLAGGILTGGTYAILSGSATGTTVNNAGTVTGDVTLADGGGNNLFDNLAGGLFNTGASVDLGAGGSLRNAGTLSPGGVGTVSTTAVTGNVTQTGAGIFEVDVDQAAGTADRIDVTETAELDGTVRVELQSVAAGEHSNIILSAAGGTTDNGLDVLASPILQASLTFPNPTDVVLTTLLDFTPDDVDLNGNQEEVADNLDDLFGATGGEGGFGPLFDALVGGIFSVSDYLDALNQLIPESYLNSESASLFAAEEFNGKMLDCPEAGFGLTAITQGECLWLRYDGRWLDRDGTRSNIGFEEDAHGISGGGQMAIARDWTLGFAAAYEDSRIDTDTNASADADRYMIGGVVKYQSGPALLALAGSFGTGEYDVARRISFGGFNATPRSSFDVHHAGATLHAAYLMDRTSWYAKPFVDLNVTHIDREAAQERGGGAANLNLSGAQKTYLSVTPALELGATIDRGDGYGLRPYVRAGVTFYADTDQSLQARFAAAPAGVGSFRTRSEFDDVHADVEAGLTVFHGEFGTMSAGYEARFGDDNDVHGFFVKGARKF